MRARDVQVGGRYQAKVSGHLVVVRIRGATRFGGWDAVNEETGRDVRIRSPQRLRQEATPDAGSLGHRRSDAAESCEVHEGGQRMPDAPGRCDRYDHISYCRFPERTADANAPRVDEPCDLCEHRGVHVQGPVVYDFGPFNAHRSCYEEWREAS